MGNAGLNLPEWVVMSDSVSMQAVYRKVAFASDTAPRGILRYLRYNTATRNTPQDEEPTGQCKSCTYTVCIRINGIRIKVK